MSGRRKSLGTTQRRSRGWESLSGVGIGGVRRRVNYGHDEVEVDNTSAMKVYLVVEAEEGVDEEVDNMCVVEVAGGADGRIDNMGVAAVYLVKAVGEEGPGRLEEATNEARTSVVGNLEASMLDWEE